MIDKSAVGPRSPVSLFFDLDGTLTDPALGITSCIRYALGALGHDGGTQLARFIGPPLHHSFAELLATDDDGLIQEAVRLYRERFATVGLYENAVFDGVPEALQNLVEEGHSLRVVTSKPTVYADRIIDHFRLRPFFPVAYGSELSGVRTDKAELLAHVLEIEQPEQAVMIGDRLHDIVGAKSNGLAAVGVLWGYGSAQELRQAGADHLVERVADIPHAVRLLLSSTPAQ